MPHNNNKSRHVSDRKRNGHTIISEEPVTHVTKDAFNSYTNIKVPSIIYITTMSNSPQKKRARTLSEDDDTVNTTCSVTENTDEPGKKRARTNTSDDNHDKMPAWAQQFMSSIGNQISNLTNEVSSLTNQVSSLETLVSADRSSSKPYYDKFFNRLRVQQYKEPVTSEPTHSVMKIEDGGGNWKCVAVTSAHLLNGSYKKAPGTDYLFVKLPRHIYEAGIESLLLPERITNSVPNTSVAHADVMVIVLRGIPEIDGCRSAMEDLVVYPMDSVPYLLSWLKMDVVGRSRRDFVTGRSVARVEKNGNYHYEFIANSGEKGDSGTILYATTEDNKKQLVGIYKGTQHAEHSNSRGFITPAIGHRELTRNPVVSRVPTRIKVIYGGRVQRFRNTFNLEEGQCKLVYSVLESTEEREVFGTLIQVPPDMISSFTEPYNSLPLDDAIDDVIDDVSDTPIDE